MKIETAKIGDFIDWLKLAKEVEPLFGPMSEDVKFQKALKSIIKTKQAFCIKENGRINAGIAISKEKNEIIWFAVSQNDRGKGYGKLMLQHAIDELDISKNITVQTFAKGTAEGNPARRLYESFNFIDLEPKENTQTGYPTVIMVKYKT